MNNATCQHEIILRLPDGPCAPVSENDMRGKHHMAVQRMKTKYINPTIMIIRSQFNSQNMMPIPAPVEVYISYFFNDIRGRDRDNYTSGSTKWLLDFLKGFAWLGDDTVKDCDLRPVQIIEGHDVTETIIRVRAKHGRACQG